MFVNTLHLMEKKSEMKIEMQTGGRFQLTHEFVGRIHACLTTKRFFGLLFTFSSGAAITADRPETTEPVIPSARETEREREKCSWPYWRFFGS